MVQFPNEISLIDIEKVQDNWVLEEPNEEVVLEKMGVYTLNRILTYLAKRFYLVTSFVVCKRLDWYVFSNIRVYYCYIVIELYLVIS